MALILIEVPLVDDLKKPCPARYLLGNALNLILKIVAHIWQDIVLRHGGWFHQNQCARFVARRQQPARSPYDSPAYEHKSEEDGMTPADYIEASLKVKLFS